MLKRWPTTTWKTSPASTYSFARFTTSWYCSRVMLRWTSIGAWTASLRGSGWSGWRSRSAVASRARTASRVARAHVVVGREVHVADQQRPVADVVVDDHGLGQHEPQVRQVELVGVLVGDLLDEAHPVVAHHADGAAHEARQLEPVGHGETLRAHAFAQQLERVAGDGVLLGAVALGPLHLAAAGPEDRPRAGADEAVAGPLVAALDRLQQEAGASVVELAEERERRVQVREDLPHHGNQVSAGRRGLEALLGRAKHPSSGVEGLRGCRVASGLAGENAFDSGLLSEAVQAVNDSQNESSPSPPRPTPSELSPSPRTLKRTVSSGPVRSS